MHSISHLPALISIWIDLGDIVLDTTENNLNFLYTDTICT